MVRNCTFELYHSCSILPVMVLKCYINSRNTSCYIPYYRRFLNLSYHLCYFLVRTIFNIVWSSTSPTLQWESSHHHRFKSIRWLIRFWFILFLKFLLSLSCILILQILVRSFKISRLKPFRILCLFWSFLHPFLTIITLLFHLLITYDDFFGQFIHSFGNIKFQPFLHENR